MIRSILLSLFFLFAVLPVIAQNEQPLRAANKAEEMFGIVEVMPYLLLKTEEPHDLQHYRQLTNQHLLKFVYSHFRYPPIARDMCISGRAVVSFTVGADGLIDQESIRCVRDLGGGIGEEVKRIIKLMAGLGWQWVPGTQNGIPVPLQFNLPVSVCLE